MNLFPFIQIYNQYLTNLFSFILNYIYLQSVLIHFFNNDLYLIFELVIFKSNFLEYDLLQFIFFLMYKMKINHFLFLNISESMILSYPYPINYLENKYLYLNLSFN